LRPDEQTRPGVKPRKKQDELTITLDKDLNRYLTFLEKMKRIGSREEAVLAALRIFKKLNMQDWLPYVYRNGDERIIILGQGMLYDIFTAVSEAKMSDIARISALKRKVINPLDPELDLKSPDNWDVVLNELENMGWGKFSRDCDELTVEFLGLPIGFLKAYLEALFQVEFGVHSMKDGAAYVLTRESTRRLVWRS